MLPAGREPRASLNSFQLFEVYGHLVKQGVSQKGSSAQADLPARPPEVQSRSQSKRREEHTEDSRMHTRFSDEVDQAPTGTQLARGAPCNLPGERAR